MPCFRHILFPVDFSDRCASVRQFVRFLARRSNAKVTLLHVFEQPPEWCGASEGAYGVVFDVDQMKQESRALLSDFFSDSEIEVATQAACGNPAESILEFAKSNGVDLIVLPTHGHGRFHRLRIGSVTAKVLSESPCALWTTAHSEDPNIACHAACQTVLAAVQEDAEQDPLIRRATEIAAGLNSQLHLTRFGAGGHSDHVLQAARDKNADLLILGRGFPSSHEVIRQAGCPVLNL